MVGRNNPSSVRSWKFLLALLPASAFILAVGSLDQRDRKYFRVDAFSIPLTSTRKTCVFQRPGKEICAMNLFLDATASKPNRRTLLAFGDYSSPCRFSPVRFADHFAVLKCRVIHTNLCMHTQGFFRFFQWNQLSCKNIRKILTKCS